MKILILSAYDAVSHSQLNSGLIKNIPEADFTLLTLPPRYFAWRTRGNSLSFAFENRDVLTAGYDHIFATSLTDITALRGFVPELAGIPLTVYFHENQFVYPASRSAHGLLEVQIVSVYNALAADQVVFNSEYNRKTFLTGADKLLRKMPDHVPGGLADMIREKSRVLSVPINSIGSGEIRAGQPVILWNHRWEYDKGPDKFLLAMRALRQRTRSFRLNIAGQAFRDIPDSFKKLKDEFADHIDHWGYAESRAEYEQLVRGSNIVVSTSLHDFQGLSVMEAADAGCIPILPDRLAYPEIFDSQYLYEGDPDDHKEASNCAEMIMKRSSEPCDLGSFHWQSLAAGYRGLFNI